VTEFLYSRKYGGVSLIDQMEGAEVLRDGQFYPPPKFDPRSLLLPHIQKIFAKLMRAGGAQADPKDIDWLEVVANWALPIPALSKRNRKKRNGAI
jgi:hypothetical protein